MDKVAIVRKVYSKDSSVSIGALFPKVDAQPPVSIYDNLLFCYFIFYGLLFSYYILDD